MGKKFAESKAFNIILAILIAVGLWVYVTSMVSTNADTSVSNIPVSIVGEDVLNGKGLMVDPSSKLSISLKLTGSRNALANFLTNLNENLTVSVNVSTIDEPGEYQLPCSIKTESSIITGAVTVEGKNEQTVSVSISQMLEKTVDVRAVFNGTLPEGYRTNTAEITPSTIRIQGPEAVIKKIQYAQVSVTGESLTKTYSGDLTFDLMSETGEVISDPDIVTNVDTVNVILPIVKTLEVPLTVDFTYGGGVTKERFDDYVSYTIEPATIQVSGAESDVAPLALGGGAIKLGVIDLATVMDKREFQFPILLSSALTNDSGLSEAKVTVKISGLETKTLSTSNIEIINAAEGYQPTAVTQTLQVTVRGPADALATIADYQLRVVVDLKDENLRHGSQFNFKAKVYLDADSQCGVVTGTDGYGVVVNIQ